MKKGMRLAAFLLAALLTLTVLAGCSAEESPSQADSKPGNIPENVEKIIAPGKYDFGGATVTIASPYPVDLENGSQESNRLKEHMAALEKNWNVKVKFELINADLYWTEMGTTVLGGGAFGDLCIGSTIYLPDWIGAGAVRDVSALAKEVGIDFSSSDWDQAAYEEYTYGNATYAFVRGVSAMNFGCLYNKKTLEAAGLKDPNQLIEEGGVWSLETFAEYARAMTVLDAEGETEVFGSAFSSWDVMLWGCISGAGGSLATYDEDGFAQLAIGSPEALAGMGIYNSMLNVDKSTAYIGWENATKMLPSGEIGLLLCEEWIVEYVRDYALENGFENDWALTYFPRGEGLDHYIDPTPGPGGYFIPVSVSDEAARRALIVYDALYAYDYGQTAESNAQGRAEELFSDEMSAQRYVDIVLGDRVSYQACRLGLYYSFSQLAQDFGYNLGTPQSLIGSYATEMESILEDSAYTQILKAQKNAS